MQTSMPTWRKLQIYLHSWMYFYFSVCVFTLSIMRKHVRFWIHVYLSMNCYYGDPVIVQLQLWQYSWKHTCWPNWWSVQYDYECCDGICIQTWPAFICFCSCYFLHLICWEVSVTSTFLTYNPPPPPPSLASPLLWLHLVMSCKCLGVGGTWGVFCGICLLLLGGGGSVTR